MGHDRAAAPDLSACGCSRLDGKDSVTASISRQRRCLLGQVFHYRSRIESPPLNKRYGRHVKTHRWPRGFQGDLDNRISPWMSALLELLLGHETSQQIKWTVAKSLE
ncbi:hypothetical protein EYF80_003751 [Liparis tanakae]|uniref:Uncharacterized protein n=1 Tax=Liparis tanakae TaxID=230148 RepID=A0A4Z2J799_9TELE|nr:hypothetical protein EYF80_003751 [Liparis tanakae]